MKSKSRQTKTRNPYQISAQFRQAGAMRSKKTYNRKNKHQSHCKNLSLCGPSESNP